MRQQPVNCNCCLTTASASTPLPTTTSPTLTTVAPNPEASPPTIIATSIIFAAITAATSTKSASTTLDIDRNPSDVISTTSTFKIVTHTSSDVDSVPTCPRCDRTFNYLMGLFDHIRIYENLQ
nr:unnamed protein product [Spirometra erinaceieuropaei]